MLDVTSSSEVDERIREGRLLDMGCPQGTVGSSAVCRIPPQTQGNSSIIFVYVVPCLRGFDGLRV